MTTSLRVQATVTADGKQASVELTNLTAKVADARIAVDAQKDAARKLSAELKTVNRDTAEGAARANEIRDALRACRIAIIEQGAAATAASRQMQQLSQATVQAGNSAGQMRAASANLGQQIGDISQGLALGISPMTIFAQQSGQVAFAMSGMGGAIGKIATFLSGPWGAAITGATIILGSLAVAHDRAGTSADRQGDAQKALKKVLDELDAATGRNNRTTEESIRLGTAAAEAALKQAQAERTKLQAKLEAARAEVKIREAQSVNPAFANEAGINIPATLAGAAGRAAAGIEAQLATNAAEQATLNAQLRAGSYKTALIAAAAATSVAAKANLEYERTETSVRKAVEAGTLTQKQAEAQLITAIKARDGAIEASRQATKDAAAATREATRDAAAYAKSLDAIASAASRATGAAIAIGAAGVPTGLKESIDRQSEADRQASGVGGIVAAIDARRAEAAGTATAKAFTAGTLADAAIIGQAIGGGVGRAFTGIAALGFGTNGKDATGVGGRLETLFKPLTDTFGNGGKRIAGLIGQAAGGAATGSVISGIGDALGIKNSKVGASIGGAIGSAIPIPGGEIIGSILGGLVGGLFGPKGSTTISGSGGKVSSTGTGSAAVQKATGAIGNTITDALQSIADQLGGSIGDFSVSIGQKKGQFRVDSSGQGRLNGGTVTGVNSESEALSLALADALKDGAIKTSPRVQTALLRYADNLNKAVAEALKVKGLEDLLADRNNPFLATFRALETQLKQRIDVARENGFNLVEIEKINGEDRAKALKDTLAAATGSVRNLLTDLTLGSGATGSPTQRLAGLTAERDRLTGLARAGDGSQLDAIASIVKQIDDLQRETFGSTAGFASGRADSVALLNDLIRQTEDRAKAAADQARTSAQTTVDKLTELNATGDDQVALLADSKALLAQIASSLAGGSAASGFALSSQYARD